MLVTLDVLKSKDACEDGIKYFKSLEKQEWEVIELMERCFKDKRQDYARWLFKCVETVEELKQIIKLYIKKREYLHWAFKDCNKVFEKDLELFKKAVEFHIKKRWSLCVAFKDCNKVFEKDLELFKKAVEYDIKKGGYLGFAFRHCNKAFENDPALHKKALEHQKQYCHKA